jgi:hypothetical protein
MRTSGSILGVVLAAALSACAHHNAAQGTAQVPGEAQAYGPSATGCPLAQLKGIHTSVTDTRDGVAITFTAPQSEVDQLRDNVHAMADANDKYGDAFAICPCAAGEHAAGRAERMPGGGELPTQAPMRTMGEKPAADAKVEETPTGAVLRLSAKDTTQARELRAAVRENTRALRKNCAAPSSERMQSPASQGGEPME